MSDKTDEELRRLIEEATRRTGRVARLDWDTLMFGPQRDFIADPSRLKVACCSRRAGKSHSVALHLLKAGFEHPGSFPIYINMNRSSAKITIWPALRAISKDLDLDLKFNNTNSNIKLPNDSEIVVYGAGSRREMDKIRGGKPPAMCLDEAQNMGSDMEYLITEVLLPSAADYQAAIMVTGTPSNKSTGPFYDICHGKSLGKGYAGWNVHHWTMQDNPHIPDYRAEQELAKAAKGWEHDSPAFRREYLGEWCRDTDNLCFVSDYHKAIVYEFPVHLANDWRYIMGVDLGTVDPCAFSILAYSRQLGKTYVLETYEEQGLSTIEAGTEIERLEDRYPRFSHKVVDSGGQGAAFVRQWKDTHPMLAVRPVKKGFNSVDMGISIINADIRAGKLFFVRKGCTDLLQEMDIMTWDEHALELGKRVIKRGVPDHAADAFRYAYTKVRNYDTGAMAHDNDMQYGSPDWQKMMESELREAAMTAPKPTEPFWKRVQKWKGPQGGE